MTDNDTFKILALDGGGTRGIYSAHMLARLEDALGKPLRECFSLIAGTSTGAIIAGAVAMNIPMKTVVELYENQAARIFKKRLFSFGPFLRSTYSSHPLKEAIGEIVPEAKMEDISTPLMIASSDITTGGVHVFKSRYLGELGEPYLRDGKIRLHDAILASCAAPTYFDPQQIDEYLLADGGLWANNPTIIAVTEAMAKFRMPLGKIQVLSVGAGHSANFYSRRRAWGLLTGWGRQKLVSYVLGLQSQASTNMARLLLGDRLLRLDTPIGSWKLDDTKHLMTMKALADRDFVRNSEAILASLERTL